MLLQRIAYLFYQHRESLRPEDVFLITPNPVFRHYIANVLPDMGERNPETLTLAEFARTLLPQGQGFGKGTVDEATLWRIDEGSLNAADSIQAGRFLRHPRGHVKLITQAQVHQVRAKWPRIEPGARLSNLMREELTRRLDSRLASMAASDEAFDEVVSLTHDEQLAAFGEPVNIDDDKEVHKAALKLIAGASTSRTV